jgi:hypothetical protein
MKVNELKKELKGMGIEIVQGSYVRKKDVERVLASKKPKVKAVLDTNTMKQGVQTLKKNKKFSELKKQYETLKSDLMGSSSFTPEEASSIINYAIHASADQVTTIDFRHGVDKIKNFKELPSNVQEAINSADHIESKGFQELIGYDKGNTAIWSAGGHWDGRKNDPSEKFIVENFGGMKCPTCKNVGIQWSNR